MTILGNSLFMSALFRGGCVGASIVSRERAGAIFHTPHARSHAAGPLLPTLVQRARAGARCFAWWRGGVLFIGHVRTVGARAGFVSNSTLGSV